jgi:hypothetical protein
VALCAFRSIDDVMIEVGCSRPTIYKALRAAGVRKQRLSSRHRRARGAGRNVHKDVLHRSASMPPVMHPAIVEGRTIYGQQVMQPGERAVLKSGINNPKTGPQILKGRWRGMAVYTLSLEERATCPTSCHHWRSCYGNNMHWAERYRAGPNLEARLEQEVADLARRHPSGFAIRLHVLGDFYSSNYVELWRSLMQRHPQLHIFGFTARWDSRRDPIAAALVKLTAECPEQFVLRFSNAPVASGLLATISIEHPHQNPPDAIICPAQMEQTASCSSCALCWESPRRIGFLLH